MRERWGNGVESIGEWSGSTHASSTLSIVVDEFFSEGASLRYGSRYQDDYASGGCLLIMVLPVYVSYSLLARDALMGA